MSLVPPKPDDCVAWITVRVLANGAMAISGTIGDRQMARSILDHARDAITRQVSERGIIVPSRDVETRPVDGLKPMGDIPIAERGDP